MNKLYQGELEQLKRRELSYKQYKESVSNYCWNSEREIKRGLQNFIKNILEMGEDKNPQRVVEVSRML